MNYFVLPGKEQIFEDACGRVVETMQGIEGHDESHIYRRISSEKPVYLIVSRWVSEAAFDASDFGSWRHHWRCCFQIQASGGKNLWTPITTVHTEQLCMRGVGVLGYTFSSEVMQHKLGQIDPMRTLRNSE